MYCVTSNIRVERQLCNKITYLQPWSHGGITRIPPKHTIFQNVLNIKDSNENHTHSKGAK